ncbi:putative extracellular alpha-1,3-glucanase/mutanase [Coniochaeta sp. 2T2.1]|nr:putative extracellular alpha-1,3-glucanase/mutanase [Coniochaeta sp. 2T2.1]
MFLHTLLLVVLGICHVQAKAVFASFMLVNSGSFDVARWTANIQLAQAAHIDAFCLNIAYGWPDNEKQIALAFTAASAAGFKLFFSFDYPGSINSTWPPDSVRPLLETYSKSPAYYQYDQYGGMPLVSTFEGSDHAADWKIINPNGSTYFFVPDYSSIGPGPALAAGGGRGVAQGLVGRAAAWPTGTSNITAIIDASYKEMLLDDRPYMMPVSPWFFSNMPGFDRTWLWNSGDLWHQRWQVVVSLDFQPEFLQIISWNDFGESHYIGPLDETQYDAFAPGRGDAPYNYVEDMPHDGWRDHLPYYIDLYKTGYATFTRESIVTWFRTSLGGACAFGSTTGGTIRQSQYENDPLLLMPDRLYFSVLLTSYAELEVTYGGQNYSIQDWDQTPDGGVGVYHTSLAITTTSGPWRAKVVRDGAVIIDYAVPQGVSDSCPKGITNWNAWVGSKQGSVAT